MQPSDIAAGAEDSGAGRDAQNGTPNDIGPNDTGSDDTRSDDTGLDDTGLLDPRWPVLAARAADDKSATDVVVLRVGEVLAITDFFVIASASNARLVRAVVEEVEERIALAGGPRPTRIEGMGDLDWVLMDYATFVVHVFGQETREYYELERLWSDVTSIDWTDSPVPPSSRGATPTNG